MSIVYECSGGDNNLQPELKVRVEAVASTGLRWGPAGAGRARKLRNGEEDWTAMGAVGGGIIPAAVCLSNPQPP